MRVTFVRGNVSVLIASVMVLAVWSVPESSSYLYGDPLNGFYPTSYPTYWLRRVYLPSPAVQLGSPYVLPPHLHHPYFRDQLANRQEHYQNPYQPQVYIDSGDIDNRLEALEQLSAFKDSYSATFNPTERVIVSSLSPPRHSIPEGFGDKSLLGFFNRFPMRFASRLTTLPNVRITYKNITLAGIAIG